MATNGYDICLFIELTASDGEGSMGSGKGAEWDVLGGKGGGAEPGLPMILFLFKIKGGGKGCFLLFRWWLRRLDAILALISLFKKLFTTIEPLTYDKGCCLLWRLFLLGKGGGISGERFPFGDNARWCGDFWSDGKVEVGVEADVDGDEIVVLSGLTAMVLVVVGYCCCKREIQKSDVS